MEWNVKYKRLLTIVLALGAGLLGIKFLLPVMLPFLLGLVVALLLSAPTEKLQERAGLRWGTASAISVSGLLLILGLLMFFLGRLLVREMGTLYRVLPELMANISHYLDAFGRWAERLGEDLPGGAGDALRNWAETITSSGGTLASSAYERLFAFVSGFLGRLPDNLMFLLTLVLSCYFTAAELPRLRAICREHLPKRRWQQAQRLFRSIKTVMGGWVRAQIALMGITFCVLFLGLLLLGVGMPFFFALGIALLDALPRFGTGTVLLPWGLFSIISGDMRLGVGLLILYGAAALIRNILEPKLLGAQVGVSPLVTLLAIYVGYRLSGLTGMILLPIGVMVISEVLEAGRRPEVLEAEIKKPSPNGEGFARTAFEK